MFSIAFNFNLFYKEIKFILVQHVCAFHAGAYFYLVECIGFEFKFGLNSIRFDLFRNRKEKEKTENPHQPSPKPS